MPSAAHRHVQAILWFAALPLALAACQRADTDSQGGRGSDDNRTEDNGPSAAQVAVGTPTPAASTHPGVEHWQCGSLIVDSQLEDDQLPDGQLQGEVPPSATMRLAFSGQSLALQHMASPSGVRYADSAGNAFTRQGDDASLTLAGDGQYECTRSQQASPWTQAATRGIAFRAVGSEPGWLVEIGAGQAPPLHATLDYGQRDVDVTQMHPAVRGFEGKTTDGTTVTLEIVRNTCRDGMSGESFEAGATLVVGDASYHGCGAYLSE